jgi:cyclopropane fatty-acyl-phospholipid synthase-like methyltransferase
MSLLQIGAGIGAPARTLAENFGVWVTGYEQSQTLTDAGNNISKMKGMSTKVNIHQYNPEERLDFERNFDRVFSKEATFTLPDKMELFNNIYKNTKSEGLFLMTDYMLINENAPIKPEF